MILAPSVRDAMLAAVPSLRAFAISLSGNVDRADDLVQETLLKSREDEDARTQSAAWSRLWRLVDACCLLADC